MFALNSHGDDDDDDMVRTDPGMPWNLKVTFSMPGEFWNRAYFLESHGNANMCLYPNMCLYEYV